MSTISSTPAAARSIPPSAGVGRLRVTLTRWWAAYINWRNERAAVAELSSMSDLELKDIGLTRGDIARAVRGEVERGHLFSRFY